MTEQDRNRPVDLTSFHVRRAVDGDAESLTWIVSHLDPFVEARILMHLAGRNFSSHDVQDLRSEVWLVTLGKISNLRPRGGRLAPVLMRFLSTTTEHKCMAFAKKQSRRRAREATAGRSREDTGPPIVDRLAADTIGAVTRIHNDDVRKILSKSLNRLDEGKRQVLVMRFLEGRSNTEIAELLGEKQNTIAVRYRRALEELARILPKSIFEGLRNIRDACRGEDPV